MGWRHAREGRAADRPSLPRSPGGPPSCSRPWWRQHRAKANERKGEDSEREKGKETHVVCVDGPLDAALRQALAKLLHGGFRDASEELLRRCRRATPIVRRAARKRAQREGRFGQDGARQRGQRGRKGEGRRPRARRPWSEGLARDGAGQAVRVALRLQRAVCVACVEGRRDFAMALATQGHKEGFSPQQRESGARRGEARREGRFARVRCVRGEGETKGSAAT